MIVHFIIIMSVHDEVKRRSRQTRRIEINDIKKTSLNKFAALMAAIRSQADRGRSNASDSLNILVLNAIYAFRLICTVFTINT